MKMESKSALQAGSIFCIILCMIVLGIESSCDETSAAIVENGILRSHIVASQQFHSAYGGVVPELASRAHVRLITATVHEALQNADISGMKVDGVAAVYGPGLIGSLLVGLSFGKSIAAAANVPFIGINHMEGHIFSNLLEERKPDFPFLSLTVSGGHTQLVLVRDVGDYILLGETIDDAAGEAYDKVAKMLGLPYPGGPLVDSLAKSGDAKFVSFPRSYLSEGSYDFSFSGLKTSVLYFLKSNSFDASLSLPTDLFSNDPRAVFIRAVCASFQAAVADVLIGKLVRAAKENLVKSIAIAGGVAANSELRRRLSLLRERFDIFYPQMKYCTDNAAMIALAGYERLRRGQRSQLTLSAEPYLDLDVKK